MSDDNVEDFELAKVRQRLAAAGLEEGHDFQVVSHGTEIIGPFRGDVYKLSSHGYLIPHIHLYKRADTAQDWTIVLDSRFELDADEDQILQWAWFLGNAMAVSAGYSCFGENSIPRNPYSCRISSI